MHDFLAVSLMNGYVTVAISLGGRTSSFSLRNGHRLDNGAWHHVEIKRMKKVGVQLFKGGLALILGPS